MSWSKPPGGNRYMVRITFVDDTYWDDGSRYTNRNEYFSTLTEAVGRRDQIVASHRYTTMSWVTNQKFTKYVDHDDVCVWCWDEKWSAVKEMSAVDLLADVAGDM